MAQVALFSAPSSHLVTTGPGQYYGMTINPVAGSTVVIADTANLGHQPDLGIPSTAANVAGAIQVLGPFPANPATVHIDGESSTFTDGLSLAYTSTVTVTVFYDD